MNVQLVSLDVWLTKLRIFHSDSSIFILCIWTHQKSNWAHINIYLKPDSKVGFSQFAIKWSRSLIEFIDCFPFSFTIAPQVHLNHHMLLVHLSFHIHYFEHLDIFPHACLFQHKLKMLINTYFTISIAFHTKGT